MDPAPEFLILRPWSRGPRICISNLTCNSDIVCLASQFWDPLSYRIKSCLGSTKNYVTSNLQQISFFFFFNRYLVYLELRYGIMINSDLLINSHLLSLPSPILQISWRQGLCHIHPCIQSLVFCSLFVHIRQLVNVFIECE